MPAQGPKSSNAMQNNSQKQNLSNWASPQSTYQVETSVTSAKRLRESGQANTFEKRLANCLLTWKFIKQQLNLD